MLAADRGPDDPVAVAAGVAAKCLTPIAGSPMVVRVVRALEQSRLRETILLCGPAAEPMRGIAGAAPAVSDGRVRWMEPAATPSTSAALALAALPEDEPVLLTTGDHALLDPDMVRHFLDQASASGGDVAVALAPHELVQKAYPRTRRTVLKFSDGRFCGCNLFAFLSPRGRGMAQLWTQVEAQRKKPIRVIGLVGWGAMLLYALGLLSVASAVRRISRQTGIDARVVTMPFAEAAIDVDSVADLDLVRDDRRANGVRRSRARSRIARQVLRGNGGRSVTASHAAPGVAARSRSAGLSTSVQPCAGTVCVKTTPRWASVSINDRYHCLSACGVRSARSIASRKSRGPSPRKVIMPIDSASTSSSGSFFPTCTSRSPSRITFMSSSS